MSEYQYRFGRRLSLSLRPCLTPVAMLCASLLASLAGTAVGQDYPTRPIRFVVPNHAGSPGDLVARILSEETSKSLKTPILVENRPGAGQMVGMEHVAKRVPADGYTLAVIFVQVLATMPLTVKELRFNPLQDLRPVLGLVEGRLIFGSSSQQPWRTFNEMVAYARANPGKLNYGDSAPLLRLMTEALLRDFGLDVVRIVYTAGAAQALISGQVQMGWVAETLAISSGDKFRVLAITGDQRATAFPNAQTFSELGYPQLRGLIASLVAPAGVPKAVVDKLHSAGSQALRQPHVRSQYQKIGFNILDQTPEVAAREFEQQVKFFADIAEKIGMRPE